MSIELQPFKRKLTEIKAIRYEGPTMDWDLCLTYRNEFTFAYDYQGGKYLIPVYRGLPAPHTGDWLVFDPNGYNLIDIMSDKIFQQTYSRA